MITAGLSSFFVPPEWVAAHGFRPERLVPEGPVAEACIICSEGICPYARAMAAAAMTTDLRTVIFAPICDQQRRMAEWTANRRAGVFLFHVPRVVPNENSRRYFRSELERLGRFLVGAGGQAPEREFLIETMRRFDAARGRLRLAAEALRAGQAQIAPRALADAFATFHQTGDPDCAAVAKGLRPSVRAEIAPKPEATSRRIFPKGHARAFGRPRLALVGGPLFASDRMLFDWIAMAGGDVVLDGTENGERTLAPPLDTVHLVSDPVEELVRAYYDSIPDVTRRPNDGLFAWVREAVRAHKIDGVILRHHVWCDQWTAEASRLGDAAGVPILTVDSSGRPDARMRTRVEAFVELLSAKVEA